MSKSKSQEKFDAAVELKLLNQKQLDSIKSEQKKSKIPPVSYIHLRAHETPEHLVCRLLLEKK